MHRIVRQKFHDDLLVELDISTIAMITVSHFPSLSTPGTFLKFYDFIGCIGTLMTLL